jgi:hypothetical protein
MNIRNNVASISLSSSQSVLHQAKDDSFKGVLDFNRTLILFQIINIELSL